MAENTNTTSRRRLLGAIATAPAVAIAAVVPTAAIAGISPFESAYRNWQRLLAAHLTAIRACDVAIDAHYAEPSSHEAEAHYKQADADQRAACFADWDAMILALEAPAANLSEVLHKVEIAIDQNVQAEHLKGVKYDLTRFAHAYGANDRTSA